MSKGKTRLVLLPGLGADPRMLYPQREAFPDMLAPDWLAPEPRETLAHYAERLAAGVARGAVHDGPVIVGGVSLGGMLALEMARHLPTRGIVLIASCREPSAVSPFMRLLERSSRGVPDPIISRLQRFGPWFVGRGGGIPAHDRGLLGEMVRGVPVPFLRWASRAIMEWPGVASPAAPVHHIHGDHDWVIPCRRVKATEVVRGGAHVLNLSHPREVNDFLRRSLVPPP